MLELLNTAYIILEESVNIQAHLIKKLAMITV